LGVGISTTSKVFYFSQDPPSERILLSNTKGKLKVSSQHHHHHHHTTSPYITIHHHTSPHITTHHHTSLHITPRQSQPHVNYISNTFQNKRISNTFQNKHISNTFQYFTNITTFTEATHTAKRRASLIDVEPVKGSRDFAPDDMRVRNWLFDKFRLFLCFMFYVLCFMFYVLCFMFYVLCFMFYVLCFVFYVLCFVICDLCFVFYVL
jgi:hypothetical protein